MKRREALKGVALLLGSAISASTLSQILTGCNSSSKSTGELFDSAQQSFLTAFAQVIVPATADSGGAKEAGVVPVIALIMKDCYPKTENDKFIAGMQAFEKSTKEKYGKDFAEITSAQQIEAVTALREIALKDKEKKENPLTNFFITGRDLVMMGYYSSEIGCTKALAYVEIPGKYDGNTTLKPGQKRWA